jgi:AraC family transcriptional regulator
MVQAPSASLQADRVTIVPDLPAHDPLLHHMALVLHPALEGEGGAGQLSSAALADALAVHVLRRYAASRPVLPEATGGLAPHQYVLRCRMEHAKRLLAETDLSLIDIVPQVGCAGHSHFTALFRQHVAMTPNAYRNTTRHACV